MFVIPCWSCWSDPTSRYADGDTDNPRRSQKSTSRSQNQLKIDACVGWSYVRFWAAYACANVLTVLLTILNHVRKPFSISLSYSVPLSTSDMRIIHDGLGCHFFFNSCANSYNVSSGYAIKMKIHTQSVRIIPLTLTVRFLILCRWLRACLHWCWDWSYGVVYTFFIWFHRLQPQEFQFISSVCVARSLTKTLCVPWTDSQFNQNHYIALPIWAKILVRYGIIYIWKENTTTIAATTT